MKKGFLRKIKNSLLKNSIKKKMEKLIKEAEKRISHGKIEPAKKFCKKVYENYPKLYLLPIGEQVLILSKLRDVEDKIADAEKLREKKEIEELAKNLSKLKSEREVYVLFEKSLIQKKLDEIVDYVKELQKQSLFSLKVGKKHLFDKLQELVHITKRFEEKNGHKIRPQEKDFIAKIKKVEETHKTKEEEKIKQKEKKLFDQIHGLVEKKPIQEGILFKKRSKPSAPPLPPVTEEKKEAVLEQSKDLFKYLKDKEKQGLYTPKPEGKSFLQNLQNSILDVERKSTEHLKEYEQKLLHMFAAMHEDKTEPLKRGLKEKSFEKEEEKKLRFLEHMTDSGLIESDKQMIMQEKERLKIKPKIKPFKKWDTEELKFLSKEEEKISSRLEKIKKGTNKKFLRRIQKKPPLTLTSGWKKALKEVKVKKRTPKELRGLVKEEEEILNKIQKLND